MDSWSVTERRELKAKGTQGVNSFALASLGLGCPSFVAWGKHAARAAPGFFLFYFGIAEPPKCDLPGIAEGLAFARCVGRRRRVLHVGFWVSDLAQIGLVRSPIFGKIANAHSEVALESKVR